MTVRRLRDLPLFWKLLLPFLALIVIFGALGAFLIVRDLSAGAQDALDQDLARRSFETRTLAHDRELYLVESANFATSIQGMSDALKAGDLRAVERLLGSVLVLKKDVNLLVAAGTAGDGRVEFRRPQGTAKPSRMQGTRWRGNTFVDNALRDPSGGKHAGFLRDGGKTLMAIAAPICSTPEGCVPQGVAIVGIEIDQLAAQAAAKSPPAAGGHRGGVTIFDNSGQLLAQAGVSGGASAPTAAPDGRLIRRTRMVGGIDVATLYAPFEVQGERVGTLAVSIPSATAYSSVRGTALRLGLIVLLVMAGVIGVGALLSRFILAQLRPLVATNRALGLGELSARAPVVSDDELGELARGVNQMAEQLQASYATLELRVTQRTEEVRRLLQERTEFFASVSHDLRTPLAVIRSQALMMLDTKFVQQPAETAKTIVDSSDQLLLLINELLELARAEAGRLEVDLQPCRLRDVVKDLRQTIDGLARSGDLDVKVNLPRDLPRVNADPRRLREVLINLIDNAVKYTAPGGTVSLAAVANNGHVKVLIRDSGIGIPEEDRENIFEPFYRVKGNHPQRGQASTGLGLALTKRLVEAQGGQITFASNPGGGTTFAFTLDASQS